MIFLQTGLESKMKLQNKAILGASVLIGGSVLLYATVNQIMNDTEKTEPKMVTTVIEPLESVDNQHPYKPLTADIETEKHILEQKRKEREAQVLQQEKNAEAYLNEQQRIEAEALARSRAENQLYVKEEEITRPVVRPRAQAIVKPAQNIAEPEKKTIEKPKTATVEPKIKSAEQTTTQKNTETQPNSIIKSKKIDSGLEKNTKTSKKSEAEAKTQVLKNNQEKPATNRPTSYEVQSGEGLIQLSRRYDVPLEVLASINQLDKNSNLHLGQKIIIPTAKQIKQSQKKLVEEQQKKIEEQQRKQQEEAKKKQILEKYKQAEQSLKKARQDAKQNDAKGNFGVQIALATDQQKADEIVKQLQSAGYKAKTSQTTRGVRIVVGPEKGKEAALALKDKINADPKLKTKEAWVLFW